MRLSLRVALGGAGVLAAIVIATAGLGGGARDANAATSGVSVKSFAFSPATIRIKPGEAVRWINDEDTVPHNVTSETAGSFASPTMRPGDSYLRTFETAGAYNYFCSIHPRMRGVVLVGDATGAPSTPPAPSPTPKPPSAGNGTVSSASASANWSLAGLLVAALCVPAAATVIVRRRSRR